VEPADHPLALVSNPNSKLAVLLLERAPIAVVQTVASGPPSPASLEPASSALLLLDVVLVLLLLDVVLVLLLLDVVLVLLLLDVVLVLDVVLEPLGLVVDVVLEPLGLVVDVVPEPLGLVLLLLELEVVAPPVVDSPIVRGRTSGPERPEEEGRGGCRRLVS
jgi:hypothetical protein